MTGRTDRLACEPSSGEERCDVCSRRPSGRKRRRVFVQHGIEEGMCDRQGSDAPLERSDVVRANTLGDEEDEDDSGVSDDDSQGYEQVEDQRSIETASIELRLKFENERREEEALRERRMEGLTGRSKIVERLERQLEGFIDKCVICVARGRTVTNHGSWMGCHVDADTMEMFTVVSEWLRKIQFEAYLGCQTCLVP